MTNYHFTISDFEFFLFIHFFQTTASFTVPVMNIATGETSGSVELKPSIFGVPVRTDLLHQMVVWHLANKRLGLASVRNSIITNILRFR